jgi:glycerophosphoryl diester phosphodiesterase
MKKLNFALLFLFCLLLAGNADAKSGTKVIAHRGYWRCEGSAQNSIRSLERANDIRAYGSEFDVHLTSDNVIVVNHDGTIQGFDIQNTPYDQLKNLQLANGETLPTLRQYLEKGKQLKHIRMILEIKEHATPERNREAADKVYAMVKELGMTGRTEFISFSLEACKEMIRIAPKSKVYYLNGELSPAQLKQLGFAGLDYQDKVMDEHPEWFGEAKQNNLKVNVWTVDDEAKMEAYSKEGADFITTNEPVKALAIVRK